MNIDISNKSKWVQWNRKTKKRSNRAIEIVIMGKMSPLEEVPMISTVKRREMNKNLFSIDSTFFIWILSAQWIFNI